MRAISDFRLSIPRSRTRGLRLRIEGDHLVRRLPRGALTAHRGFPHGSYLPLGGSSPRATISGKHDKCRPTETAAAGRTA